MDLTARATRAQRLRGCRRQNRSEAGRWRSGNDGAAPCRARLHAEHVGVSRAPDAAAEHRCDGPLLGRHARGAVGQRDTRSGIHLVERRLRPDVESVRPAVEYPRPVAVPVEQDG